MTETLLRAERLQHSYRGVKVVDVAELTAQRGEVLAVLGPNGSGKSTLFRLLMQLEKPDAGTIDVRGSTAGVFQQPFLFTGTVRDNIAFGLKGLSKDERAARTERSASEFGIVHLLDKSVRSISGGEAQRVALARAIALEPAVLFLDEPTSSLDVLVKRTFREDVLRAARNHAGAVVLITHDPAEAFGLADRIAVMDRGRIVQSGMPEDLLDDPRTPFVASFTGAELLLDGRVNALAEDLVHVDVGGCMIWAVLIHSAGWTAARGDHVHVAYRPEDVMISSIDAHAEVSARNAFRLRIAAMSGSGGLVRLRLEGTVSLVAMVTRNSVESLGLRPGRDVIAHMKATALRVLRA